MKPRALQVFLLFSFLAAAYFASAQNLNTDSLDKVFKTTKYDTVKVSVLLVKGGHYYHHGNYSESLKCYLSAQEISKPIGYNHGIGASYNGMGIVYEALGNYSDAIKALYKSLEMAEKSGKKDQQSACLINISLLFMDQGNFEEALKCCNRAAAICKETGNKSHLGFVYNSSGLIYYYMGEHGKALPLLYESLKLRQELGDKKEEAGTYCNLGVVYGAQGDKAIHKDTAAAKYQLAKQNYMACLNLMREMKNELGLAQSFANLGSLYTRLKKYKEARAYSDSGMVLFKTIGSKESLKSLYLGMVELDTIQGKYKDAFYHFRLFTLFKDSLRNQEHTRQTTQTQMQYEFKKKTELDSLKNAELVLLENIKHEEEIKQQRFFTYGGAIGFALMLVIAGVSFKAYKTKQKANVIISGQKAEVEKQKDIIEEQKRKVEEHQQEIIDSITYAKRLQEAILPPVKEIKETLTGSFVLYKPKDIVAGDFYWFEQRNGVAYIAAADCTGHGVPGAMVSVVCSNALNRTVLEFGLSDPGKILDKTRELVLETFSKSDTDVKDGMDISLAKIELIKESKKVQPGKIIIPKGQSFSEIAQANLKYRIEWSGANNPLWYFKNGVHEEITAHKQPIGKTDAPTPFTTHAIELGKGDSIYLLTDGYADQFGGPKGKKFKYRQLLELLASNQDKTPAQMSEILDTAFENWRGDMEQIDDVTIIGIKL